MDRRRADVAARPSGLRRPRRGHGRHRAALLTIDGMSAAAAPHGGLGWALVPVGLAATLVSAMWLRFGGQWAETDTVVLTRAARGVLDQSTINPAGVTYGHGFAYPTLLATLAEVTGVSVRVLQTTILPWLTVGTALVACV